MSELDITQQSQVTEEYIELLRKKSRDSLFFFARAILGFNDLTKDIHLPICHELENYLVNTRCVIVLPRDWFKSTIGAIAYPIWRAIRNPNIRILIAQNSFTNATKKIASIKQIFEKNTLLRQLFPEVLPNTSCIWRDDCLMLNREIAAPEGTFEGAGVGTAVISRHFDLIIEDDTVSPSKDSMTGLEQQPTQSEIEKAIGWHRLSHPLLLHPSRSQIVIIGTRWAEGDLIGYVLDDENSKYRVITRAVREKDGKPATRAEGGIAVWDRFDEETLDELERELGPYMFATLMMNKPTSASNQTFKRDWIRYYEKIDSQCVYFTSVDPANPKSESSSDPDYNVIMTCGVNPKTGKVFVAHYDRGHYDPGEVIERIFYHYSTFKPLSIVIESVAYQRTLIYWLEQKQKEKGTAFYVEPLLHAKVSKDARIKGLQPFFSNGQILIKRDHDSLERELLAFRPESSTSHDDVIDALSMQIPKWNDVILTATIDKEEKARKDPMSGLSIIDELTGVQQTDKYPFDMGIMKDRVNTIPFPVRGKRARKLAKLFA